MISELYRSTLALKLYLPLLFACMLALKYSDHSKPKQVYIVVSEWSENCMPSPPPPSPAPPPATPPPPPRSAAASHQIHSPTTGSPSSNPTLNPPPSGGARAAPEALRTAVPPLCSIVVGSIRIQLEEDFAHARTSSSRRVSFSSGCRVSLPPHRRHYSPPPKRHSPRPAADLPPQMLLEVDPPANRPTQSQVQTFMSWFLPNAAGTRLPTAPMDWTRRNGPRSARSTGGAAANLLRVKVSASTLCAPAAHGKDAAR